MNEAYLLEYGLNLPCNKDKATEERPLSVYMDRCLFCPLILPQIEKGVLGFEVISCCIKNAEISERDTGWDSFVISHRYLNMMSVRFVKAIDLLRFIISC
mgnify:CR=1 FL=1